MFFQYVSNFFKWHTISINDQRGNPVYSTENAPLGNVSQSWSGQYKGKKRPTGVYIYVIVIEYGNGTSDVLMRF